VPAPADRYDDSDRWADREEARVREALASTAVAVGVEADGELVAAAHVLTDFTVYATVYDVIVAADRRGDGLGRTLVEAVTDHPALQGVDGLSLAGRRSLAPFDESVGFARFDGQVDVPAGDSEAPAQMAYRFDRGRLQEILSRHPARRRHTSLQVLPFGSGTDPTARGRQWGRVVVAGAASTAKIITPPFS